MGRKLRYLPEDNHLVEITSRTEPAYALRYSALRATRADPVLANLHDDPRWMPFLEKLGLVDSPL